VYEALDLCLACKGCQAECPSSVDVARLRYEFLHYYYSDQSNIRHHRRMRDYLFGYIDRFARLGHHFAPFANLLMRAQFVRRLADRTLGLAEERPFPELASRALQAQPRLTGSRQAGEQVLLLSDAFTEYFQPEVGQAALRVLESCGCSVEILPVIGAGRTLISKGFLVQARKHAQRLVEAIRQRDPEGTIPVVGVEPSEILTLRDEYCDLLPGDPGIRPMGDPGIRQLAARSFLLDEFLLRPGKDGRPRLECLLENRTGSINPLPNLPAVLLHTHCYQKAQPPASDGLPSGAEAAFSALARAGFEVEDADSGCCGMAGAFGYEAEHYEISRQIGELKLLPAIRSTPEEILVVAAGVSCEAQISDLSGRNAIHPAILLDRYIKR
jgi:Fe-S oxidoreductase